MWIFITYIYTYNECVCDEIRAVDQCKMGFSWMSRVSEYKIKQRYYEGNI